MDEPLIPLPKRVAARRKQLGISYETVAERLSQLCGFKIKWQSVQQFERGDSKHPRFIKELAQALETSDEFLSGRTDDPKAHASLTKTRVAFDHRRRGGHSGQEGDVQNERILRLIGRLEERLEVLEGRLINIERGEDHPKGRPQGGTKARR